MIVDEPLRGGAARRDPWYLSIVPTSFDVCGTPALERIEGLLRGCGYRSVAGRPGAPGEYSVQPTDAAPGWSDWMYGVDVCELAEHPVSVVLARYREIEQAETKP